MSTRQATCSCGALSIECEGEPIRVSVCHCLACQKRTGSAFGVQARYPREHVRGLEAGCSYVRIGDSGGRIEFRFCQACGSTVCWEIDGLPGFVAVAVGAFADPSFLAPSVSIYEARQHPWVSIHGEIKHLE